MGLEESRRDCSDADRSCLFGWGADLVEVVAGAGATGRCRLLDSGQAEPPDFAAQAAPSHKQPPAAGGQISLDGAAGDLELLGKVVSGTTPWPGPAQRLGEGVEAFGAVHLRIVSQIVTGIVTCGRPAGEEV